MKYLTVFLLILLSLIGCQSQELIEVFNMISAEDKTLPKLISLKVEDQVSASAEFNENVKLNKVYLDSNPISWEYITPSKVKIKFNQKLKISQKYELYFIAQDLKGNTSSFLFTISGTNPNIPILKITELSSKGTDTQPERIELFAHSSGNTEGIYCANGTKGNESYGFTLPSIDVKRGDYIVIYWNSEPEKESFINKTGNTAYLVKADSPTKLATNNGCFVIYDSISGNGTILDALVYYDGEATTYSNLGSASVEKSYNELKNEFEWFDEPVLAKFTTSTRTINRIYGSDDTNRATDFYICDTKGISFGNSNTETLYKPEI